jgi:site-specific DNA recombinase
LVHTSGDNDKSASTNAEVYRPDYEDMLNRLEAGPVRIVLSYTTSRLTRKPEETERQIKLAREHGVQYYYVRGQALDLQVVATKPPTTLAKPLGRETLAG